MVCMCGYFEWLFRVVVSHGLVGVHGLARWFICLVTLSGCFVWLFHVVVSHGWAWGVTWLRKVVKAGGWGRCV
jgi:hypothetical protein